MDKVELYPTLALGSGFVGTVLAALTVTQLVLTPENVWIPMSVAVGFLSSFLVVSIWATVKAVRMFDKITRNQSRIMKHLDLEDE